MRIVTSCVLAVSLAACAGAGGTTLTPLPAELASTARIGTIALLAAPEGQVSAEFEQVFQTGMAEALGECATGDTPLNLEVNLHQFERANPAMTWLLADSNNIAGTVRVIDPSSGAAVGEYEISRSFSASGLLGVALMSQAEEQMSKMFGEELCKRAFPER